MPQWAGSCWYYLRFIDPINSQCILDAEAEKYWMPVDLYVGGAEHTVLHLLYARFWHKVGLHAVLSTGILHWYVDQTAAETDLAKSSKQLHVSRLQRWTGSRGTQALCVVACRFCKIWVWSVTRSLSRGWSVRA